jgi:hypothetical protein
MFLLKTTMVTLTNKVVTYACRILCRMPVIIARVSPNLILRERVWEPSSIKLNEQPSSRSRVVPWEQRGNRRTEMTKIIIFFLFFESAAKTSLKMSPLIFWDLVPELKQNINITKLIRRIHVHEKYSCSFLTVSEIL